MDATREKNSTAHLPSHYHCGQAVESAAEASVDSGQSVLEAARLMALRGVGCLPVIDHGRLVGVVSERDIVAKIVAAGLDPAKSTVDLAMTLRPRTVDRGQPLADAFTLMNEHGLRHVPVMLDGAVLGVISPKSLLRLLQEPR